MFRCILWPIVGLAGESAQLAYIDLISNLVKLVILNPSLASHPPLVQQSLSWAKDSLVDTLSALLTLISGQEKIPSGNAKYQLLILFCQHLQLLFVDYEDRYKSILNLLRNIVLRTEEREMYEKLLTSRSELGYVGGWISSRPCHSFLSIPAQYHAFTILELFVYYNSKINNLPESVLGVLYECEALLEAESKRQHHIISPLIDQRLLLAIRRVKFYCKSDKIETIMTKSNNIQTPNSKGGFNSTDGTPKKMITSRRVSAAFTTFDNSMSDAFLTPEINRKRVDITSGLTPGHINPGCDVVDTMFRIQIAPEYSLPIDVEKVFSIFSSYANSLDNNLVTNSSKSSDAYVCTSDLLGLIDDVLDSYLIVYSPLFQKLPSLVSNDHYRRSKLMSETYDLRDTKEWKQINGSSDMFTVLCSIISYDSYNQDVRFAVRIMNSSGFKVPLFSVQLLLSSIDHYETTTTTATTTTTTATTLKASFDSNKTSSILEGVEYFHLDGLIERIFTIHFHEFSNIFLHIRLIYRELLAESDSIEIFSIPIVSTMNQIDENSTTTNTTTEQKKRFKETDLCRTAKLECIPFQFPVFNFLYPYGGSSLSSMTNYRLNLLSNSSIISFLGGIPKNIYQSLHNRLKRSVRLPVIGYCSKNTSTSTTNSIPVIPNFNDEITLEYYNQYYNSKDNYSYQRNINTLINSRVRLGNGNHSSIREFSTSLAWCFQTWWGYEVCITIQLSKLYQSSLSNPFNTQQGGSNMTGATSTSTTSSTSGPESEKYYLYWSGWMEIQCDDISTLNALKYDSLTLLQFLTNNLLQVTSPTSLTASTILSSKSFVHENENKTNNFTTNSLSQSNGLFPLINPSNTVPPPSLPPPLSSSQTTSASKNLFQPAAGTTSKNHEDKKNLLKSKIRNFIHQKFLSENKTFHESSLGGGSGNGGLSLL